MRLVNVQLRTVLAVGGVGGLAVGLALQNLVQNLISGHLGLAQNRTGVLGGTLGGYEGVQRGCGDVSFEGAPLLGGLRETNKTDHHVWGSLKQTHPYYV